MEIRMKKRFILFTTVLVLCFIASSCSKKTGSTITTGEPTATPTITEQQPENTPTPEPTKEVIESTTEPTIAPTTEAQSNTSTENVPLNLSDDLYSFQLQMDGVVYQFPMTYQQFISQGWTYLGDLKTTLDPNQYTVAERFKKGDYEVYISFVNFGMDTTTLDNCLVAGISMDQYLVKDNGLNITLPGGIKYMESTLEDIIAAYGTESSRYDGSLYTKLTYEYDSYQDIELSIDLEKKVLNEISITNLIETEETKNNTQEVSNEIPEIVTKYQAPTELGTNIQSFIVLFDKNLYHIPAPVSEFVKNGWVIKESDTDMTVKAKDYGWVTLRKDNQELRGIANNYSEKATTIENCFLTTVVGDKNTTNVEIEIQKGIKRGISASDLEKALEGVTYEKEDAGSLIFYSIVGPYSKLDNIEIVVSGETKLVQKIKVNNSPKLANLFE